MFVNILRIVDVSYRHPRSLRPEWILSAIRELPMPAPPIRVHCPGCDNQFKVKAEYAGRKFRCPTDGCGQTLVVPMPEAEPEPAPRPQPRPQPAVAAGPPRSAPVARPAARPQPAAAAPRRRPRSDDDEDDEPRRGNPGKLIAG